MGKLNKNGYFITPDAPSIDITGRMDTNHEIVESLKSQMEVFANF